VIACYKGFNAGEGAEGVGRRRPRRSGVFNSTVLDCNFSSPCVQPIMSAMIKIEGLRKSWRRGSAARKVWGGGS